MSIIVKFGPVVADKFVTSNFETKGKTVLLKQEVLRYYGSTPNPLFPNDVVLGEPYKSVRTFLMKGIPETKSIADVNAVLPKTAKIQQTLSHQPIITENLQSAIEQGLIDIEKIKSHQLIQAPDTETGEIVPVLDKVTRAPMYRLMSFDMSGTAEDVDLRTYTDAEKLAAKMRKASEVEQAL
jgi:hypothetical protein